MFENNPFAAHTIEILIMLLGAFFIGLWLGWILWGKIKEELSRLQVDNQSLNVTLDALRVELDSIKTRASLAEADNSNLTAQVENLNRENANLREKSAYWEAQITEIQLRNRQLETELGLSFTPNPVPEQEPPMESNETPTDTEMPVSDNVSTMEEPKLEVELPVPPVLIVEPTSVNTEKPEKTPKQKSGSKAEPAPPTLDERDDLTVVEGIGPKIQLLLNQYGIHTYRQLAEADVAKLKEILATAGPQLAMHDPGTWPSQANLAANDQWDTLKSVQGFLKGGKKPD